MLAARGTSVWAHEDLPYAIHSPQGLAARLDQQRDAIEDPVLVPVASTMATKLDAVAAYASQLPGDLPVHRRLPLGAEAPCAGSGGAQGPAERFWRVRG